MSVCDCARDCGSGPQWSGIWVNLASDSIFFCLCLLVTVCVWRFGWSWPRKRAEKKALIEDLEAANAKLAKTEEGRRLRVAHRRLGRRWCCGPRRRMGFCRGSPSRRRRSLIFKKSWKRRKPWALSRHPGLGPLAHRPSESAIRPEYIFPSSHVSPIFCIPYIFYHFPFITCNIFFLYPLHLLLLSFLWALSPTSPRLGLGPLPRMKGSGANGGYSYSPSTIHPRAKLVAARTSLLPVWRRHSGYAISRPIREAVVPFSSS